MARFLKPVLILGFFCAILAALIIFFVPPVNYFIVGALLLLLGISLASFLALGIYYLRRFWGPKDSPRVVLRTSIRQALIVSLGLVLILVLQILGAANYLNFFLLGLFLVVLERLTK